jgi:hypothetical protein
MGSGTSDRSGDECSANAKCIAKSAKNANFEGHLAKFRDLYDKPLTVTCKDGSIGWLATRSVAAF